MKGASSERSSGRSCRGAALTKPAIAAGRPRSTANQGSTRNPRKWSAHVPSIILPALTYLLTYIHTYLFVYSFIVLPFFFRSLLPPHSANSPNAFAGVSIWMPAPSSMQASSPGVVFSKPEASFSDYTDTRMGHRGLC